MTQSYLNIHDDTGNSANTLTAPSSAILAPMSKSEAEQALSNMRTKVQELASIVYDFWLRDGHKALGYATLEALFDSGVLTFSKARFYQLINIAEVNAKTSLPVPDTAVRELNSVPPGLRSMVIGIADKAALADGEDEVGKTYVVQTFEAIKTALTTNTWDGHTPLTAIVSEAVHESNARQRLHIEANSKRRKLYGGDDTDTAIDMLMQASERGRQVYVSIYIEDESIQE